jgi:diguanylate cyclase (GGDEF)-like protein/PAS domain S-box-containing protein
MEIRKHTHDETEKEWERFFLFSIDLLCTLDAAGKFLRVNPAFEQILGYRDKDLEGHFFTEFIHPHDWTRTKTEYDHILQGQSTLMFESRFRRKDGSYRLLSWTAYPFLGESVIYAVARDITEEIKTKEKLEKMAFTDDLTGLLNRRGFYLFAMQLWQVALREKKRFLVFAVDLDNLKNINDHYGHAEGDAALRRFARILKGRFRTSDVVARLGGDEFAAALITDEDTKAHPILIDLKKMAEEDREGRPYDPLSFSIGYSHAHVGRRLSLEDMLQEADGRMYQEKMMKHHHNSFPNSKAS